MVQLKDFRSEINKLSKRLEVLKAMVQAHEQRIKELEDGDTNER